MFCLSAAGFELYGRLLSPYTAVTATSQAIVAMTTAETETSNTEAAAEEPMLLMVAKDKQEKRIDALISNGSEAGATVTTQKAVSMRGTGAAASVTASDAFMKAGSEARQAMDASAAAVQNAIETQLYDVGGFAQES